jgi:hypothetical protein
MTQQLNATKTPKPKPKRLSAALLPDTPKEPPTLRFTPTAWAKLLFLRDLGDSEVGGFGIAAADDLLLVEDVKLVRQTVTVASVAFDDQAVAEFFDEQVDLGRKPEQFARIWLHTHPGNSPEPSGTDEGTFHRVFGRTDWALMFILAQGGQRFARLRFHVGPGGDVELPVGVEYGSPFAASDHAAWDKEYTACVQVAELPTSPRKLFPSLDPIAPIDPWDDDWLFDREHRLAADQDYLDAMEARYAIG